MTKRKEQALYLHKKLLEINENVDSLVGTKQTFDKNCRILIGITSKCGTGFDFPKLDALILAGDVDEYFIQILGRVFRTKDNIPFVFDLIDNNPILVKHFNNRKEVYQKAGGKLINFNRKFSNLLI